MKLIYVANARLPTEKAHGAQIMSMCGAFARADASVTLIVPRRWGNPVRAKGGPFAYYDLQRNFKIVRLPCIDFLWTEFRWSFWLQEATFLASVMLYLWTHDTDIVYSRDLYLALLAHYLDAPLVLEAHVAPSRILEPRRHLASRVGRLVVVTTFLRDRWVQWGIDASRVIVASDAVDSMLFARYRVNRDSYRTELGFDHLRVITYVGQLHTMGVEKGVADLISAFSIMRATHTDAILCIVGGPDSAITRYRALADDLDLADRVRFAGQVEPALVPAYEVASDVLVAPFPMTDHFAYEMSPLKIFEYRAAGVPIVATHLPAVREALGGTEAILVPPGDVGALADGLGRALEADKKIKGPTPPSWDDRARAVLAFIH